MPRTAPKRETPLDRDEIDEAALAMVRSAGIDGFSLRRLADQLGVTAPALYAHMRDKNDLLASVAAQGFERLTAAFAEVQAPDPIERLFQFGRCYVEVALAEPEVFEVMFVFRPNAVPLSEIDNELPAATAAFDLPQRSIDEAIASGQIHPDRDPLLTAMTLWTGSHGIATVLLLGRRGSELWLPENYSELMSDALHTMLAGMALPPVG